MREQRSRPLRVLLIEDSRADTRLIQRYLQPFDGDMELHCVASADEAWEHLGGGVGVPHLIIVDHFMGMHSGADFVRRLKQSEGLCLIPAVVLSVSDEPALILEAFGLGACGWLLKDERMEERLQGLIRYWLEVSIAPGRWT